MEKARIALAYAKEVCDDLEQLMSIGYHAQTEGQSTLTGALLLLHNQVCEYADRKEKYVGHDRHQAAHEHMAGARGRTTPNNG